jgi:hypothetical protein
MNAVKAATELVDDSSITAIIGMKEIHRVQITENKLEPLSSYQVKIYYLGVLGTSFYLGWDCKLEENKAFAETDSLEFTTDKHGKIEKQCYFISVQANRNTRAATEEAANRSVWYTIKLEKLNNPLPLSTNTVKLISGIFFTVFLSFLLSLIMSRWLSPKKVSTKRN